MEFDAEKQVLMPQGDELSVLGLPEDAYLEWPVNEAGNLAIAILAGKVRTAGMDLSEVPRGAAFMKMQENQRRLMRVADEMQAVVARYLPIVSDNDIEKFLAS